MERGRRFKKDSKPKHPDGFPFSSSVEEAVLSLLFEVGRLPSPREGGGGTPNPLRVCISWLPPPAF